VAVGDLVVLQQEFAAHERAWKRGEGHHRVRHVRHIGQPRSPQLRRAHSRAAAGSICENT
jgi:hypothetical protein